MIQAALWVLAFISLIVCAVLDAFGVAPTLQWVLIILMVVFTLASCAIGWRSIARNLRSRG